MKMKECMKKIAPKVAFWSYCGGMGIFIHHVLKHEDDGPLRTVRFQGIEYTFGSNKPNAEEQKNSVRNQT